MDILPIPKPIIAITGDAGKTTTKEMIASILQTKYAVFKSYKNGNDLWFTKQYAASIQEEHEAIVLEYGLRFPGDIAKMCSIIPPNIGIITNLGGSHVGNFSGNLQAVAEEKSELIRSLPSKGLLLLNAEDPLSGLLNLHSFSGTILAISLRSQASQIQYTEKGMSFSVYLDGINHRFDIPIFGSHHVYNALFAIALSHHLGLTPEQIKRGLQKFRPIEGRMCIEYLPSRSFPSIRIIDDANSTKAASLPPSFEVLQHVGNGKRILIFACSSVNDKGIYADKQYEQAGEALKNTALDHLFVIGSMGKCFAQGAIKGGLSPSSVTDCCTLSDFYSAFERFLTPFMNQKSIPTILLKGPDCLKLKRFLFLFSLHHQVPRLMLLSEENRK